LITPYWQRIYSDGAICSSFRPREAFNEAIVKEFEGLSCNKMRACTPDASNWKLVSGEFLGKPKLPLTRADEYSMLQVMFLFANCLR